MSVPSRASLRIRAALSTQAAAISEILDRYSASNLRIFGSVARGEATANSDLDLLVDMKPGRGNELLRVSGIGEELRELLGISVDVVSSDLLRDEVSATAVADAVAV